MAQHRTRRVLDSQNSTRFARVLATALGPMKNTIDIRVVAVFLTGVVAAIAWLLLSAPWVMNVEIPLIYPALYRIEQKGWVSAKWSVHETGRDAKFYKLTRAGRKQLEAEEASWDRLVLAVAKVRQAT